MIIPTLAQINARALYTFRPDEVEGRRPATLARIATCISRWAVIEAMYGQVVAFSLQGNSKISMAMYLAITSAGAQSSVLKTVTRLSLPSKYRIMFEAIWILGSPLAEERHRLAHWLLGYSKDVKSGLLLLDPKDGLRQLTHNLTLRRGHRPSPLSPNEIRVATNSYLNDLNRRLANYYYSVSLFVGMISMQRGFRWSNPKTEWQYQLLYNEPQIRAAIDRLSGGQKNTQESPPPPRRSGRRARPIARR